MDRNGLIERLMSLSAVDAMAKGDSAFSNEDKTLIEEAYKLMLGKEVRKCSCKSRYADAFVELLSNFKKSKTMNKYVLKAGALIWLGNNCYTRHNLTDKVAKEYLKLHPDAVNLFEAIPEDKKANKSKVDDKALDADAKENTEADGKENSDADNEKK